MSDLPLPAVLAALCLVMSLVTFGVYAWDKRRARLGGQRVRERTLHLLALFGGWSGALVGQRLLRHKTRKLGFQVLTWTIVTLHVAVWGWWAIETLRS